MMTKLPPVGFKILQISLQIMHHFLSRLCWQLLKVHFVGHAHVKFVLDVGMWVSDWECGSLVPGYQLSMRLVDPHYFNIISSGLILEIFELIFNVFNVFFKLSSLFSYSVSLSNASLSCACVNSRLRFSSWFSLFTDPSSSSITIY